MIENYYAIFFDELKPSTKQNQLLLKIDKNKFHNLLEEISSKTVELKFTGGDITHYKIIQRFSFEKDQQNFLGSQSDCFIICNVKKAYL